MGVIGKTKLAILRALEKEALHGYALARRATVAQSSVYEHLAELRKAGLVEVRTSGRRLLYSLTREGGLLVEASRRIR